MNLLSIDWDYFFPDISEYDWQMNETRFLFYEFIWHIRWSNYNMRGTKLAKEDFNVNQKALSGFWDKVLNKHIPMPIYIADSHRDIEYIFKTFSGAKFNVWNFDQHHDLGYGSNNGKLDCGNWAEYFKSSITQYNLVYPEWRKQKGELIEFDESISVHYSIPDNLPEFDLLFICRSSPFTPSWEDKYWFDFVHYFEAFPLEWDSLVSIDYVLNPRPFNKTQAMEFENQWRDMLKKGL